MTNFPIDKIRKDFPILSREIRGKDLIYLDSAASSQRPQSVISRISELYSQDYANVHRGIHFLSSQLTGAYEAARMKIAKFIGAGSEKEIIFTRGTTESVNLVATAWGRKNIKAGDEILVTALEHHSNFVPWQTLARENGAKFRILEVDAAGRFSWEDLEQSLANRPKIFACSMMSNVLGTILPIAEIAEKTKKSGTLLFVDAAQGVPHLSITLADLGPIDFLAFSGHKMCGPSGIGVLWAKQEVLTEMDPYQYGGDMISHVGDQQTTWNDLPWKFEAGTPHIEGVIAFATAVDYLEKMGRTATHNYESMLTGYALQALARVQNLKIFGPATTEGRGGVFSFLLEGVHPHDVGSFLDVEGIAIRVGHHCAQPLMRRLGVEGTCRASLYFYNTTAEIDRLCEVLEQAKKVFL